MWSPDQRPCTVTVALLPRPGFYVTGCLFVAVQNLEDWEVRLMQEGCPGFGAPGFSCRAHQRKKDSRGLIPSTPILKCEPSGFWPA